MISLIFCASILFSYCFLRFLVSGGWGILNKWLNEYSGSENIPVLIEIIEVFVLSVTFHLLSASGIIWHLHA